MALLLSTQLWNLQGASPEKKSLYLVDSHKLPHHLTALVQHKNSLISANGMVLIIGVMNTTHSFYYMHDHCLPVQLLQ